MTPSHNERQFHPYRPFGRAESTDAPDPSPPSRRDRLAHSLSMLSFSLNRVRKHPFEIAERRRAPAILPIHYSPDTYGWLRAARHSAPRRRTRPSSARERHSAQWLRQPAPNRTSLASRSAANAIVGTSRAERTCPLSDRVRLRGTRRRRSGMVPSNDTWHVALWPSHDRAQHSGAVGEEPRQSIGSRAGHRVH
jgi:hypothetical protein